MSKREIKTSPDTPGGFLRFLRNRKKKTQQEVMQRCKTLGVPVINVSDVETNNKVKLHSLDKLAKLYILTGTEKKRLRELIVSSEEQSGPAVEGVKRTRTRGRNGFVREGMDSAQEELRIFYDLMQLPEEARKRVVTAASTYYSPSHRKKKVK